MKLCWSKSSPFVRKVSAALQYHELWDQVETMEIAVRDPASKHEEFLLLGKIPALETKPNYWLFDSPVICQYVDYIGTKPKLYPEGEAKFDVLRLEALADGVMDNMVQILIEKMTRSDHFWVERNDQLRKRAVNSLKYLDSLVDGFKDNIDMAVITIVCMVDWLEFRQEVLGIDVKLHAPKVYQLVKQLDKKYTFLANTLP